jgi:hypothetical protein
MDCTVHTVGVTVPSYAGTEVNRNIAIVCWVRAREPFDPIPPPIRRISHEVTVRATLANQS